MVNKRLKKEIGLGDKGKYFEGKLRTAFTELKKRDPFFFYRFPDSRTAGRVMQPSPCDFLALANGRAWLIEAKESEVYECFSECYRAFLKTPQGKTETANIRQWIRAGGLGAYLFYSHITDKVQFWAAPNLHAALFDDAELLPARKEFEVKHLQSELKLLLF